MTTFLSGYPLVRGVPRDAFVRVPLQWSTRSPSCALRRVTGDRGAVAAEGHSNIGSTSFLAWIWKFSAAKLKSTLGAVDRGRDEISRLGRAEPARDRHPLAFLQILIVAEKMRDLLAQNRG
jgi:hypothetical protein